MAIGPSITVKKRCSGCDYEKSESYACQGDSGHDVYCTHPSVGKKHVGDTNWTRGTRQDHEQKALKQAQTSVCSVLRDWVKGKVTAVECGVMSFEAAFMPHMLLPSGERVIDRVQAEKLLPPPGSGNVVALK